MKIYHYFQYDWPCWVCPGVIPVEVTVVHSRTEMSMGFVGAGCLWEAGEVGEDQGTLVTIMAPPCVVFVCIYYLGFYYGRGGHTKAGRPPPLMVYYRACTRGEESL